MDNNRRNFWLGNGLLAVALVLMLFISQLWPVLGVWSMVLWMIMAGAGMYFITRDRGDPGQPD